VTGGYIGTSAQTGQGIPELLASIKQQVNWEEMPTTVTNEVFKAIKDVVLTTLSQPVHIEGDQASETPRRLLISPDELRKHVTTQHPDLSFSSDETAAAIAHLAKHGYASVLRRSTGEKIILLDPDRLNNLAASFVLEARRDAKGLGVLEESRVMNGAYDFPELRGLDENESGILLDAATAIFIKNHICFRETFGLNSFFVFPSLINQKRPVLEDLETTDGQSYSVSGSTENVYAALVVLLGYTNTFTRTNQWQNQAQYELGPGEVCGFRQIDEREGQVELVIYYGINTPNHARLLFQGLFENFLRARQVSVTAYPAVACSGCGTPQSRSAVVESIRDALGFMFCRKCGRKLLIPGAADEVALGSRDRDHLEKEQSMTYLRTAFEAALVVVKRFVSGRRPPSCFISYAWGNSQHERWVRRLATDLEGAGVSVVLDRNSTTLGWSVGRFISEMDAIDFILVVGTPHYLQKYKNQTSATGYVVAAEVDLVNQRLLSTEPEKTTVLPLLLSGTARESFPPLLRGRVYADFRDDALYFGVLFDLVLVLHGVPVTEASVTDLRDGLAQYAG